MGISPLELKTISCALQKRKGGEARRHGGEGMGEKKRERGSKAIHTKVSEELSTVHLVMKGTESWRERQLRVRRVLVHMCEYVASTNVERR
mmetsp:Transcript_29604/g.76493  ORF Transcript_29604/g.76493 Transcript_29604/m.76493 type:complete len:91 (+) Transcript_29604:3507-3779(+)